MTGRVQAFMNSAKANMAAGVTVQVQSAVEAYDIATGGILGITNATLPSLVTSTGTGELPPQAMLGVRLLTTTVVGRQLLKGRWFWGPLASAVAGSGGLPAAGSLTALTTACGFLFTGATSTKLQVWKRPSPSHVGGIAADVSTCAMAPKFWTLNSRRD